MAFNMSRLGSAEIGWRRIGTPSSAGGSGIQYQSRSPGSRAPSKGAKVAASAEATPLQAPGARTTESFAKSIPPEGLAVGQVARNLRRAGPDQRRDSRNAGCRALRPCRKLHQELSRIVGRAEDEFELPVHQRGAAHGPWRAAARPGCIVGRIARDHQDKAGIVSGREPEAVSLAGAPQPQDPGEQDGRGTHRSGSLLRGEGRVG